MVARSTQPKVDLDNLFSNQRGLATRRQLIAAGIDDEVIRQRLRSGRWQRVLPGLYANTTGGITLEQRRVAASLFVGGQGQVTGIAALTWHGFTQLPADPLIHMLVPHRTRRGSRGFVRVQRTHRLDPTPQLTPHYAVCSVARAVCDAGRGLSNLRDVRAIVAEAVQRGFTTVEELRAEVNMAGTSRTALLHRALREVDAGARSAPEVELQETLRPSTVLPTILWNPRLEALDGTPLPSPDGWIDDVGIAVEVDSREYHLGPDGWQQTLRRHNLLASYGALVLHFTPSELRGRRRSVRGVVERAYEERLASGATAAIRVVSVPGTQQGAPHQAQAG
jgi:hypothetical protein